MQDFNPAMFDGLPFRVMKAERHTRQKWERPSERMIRKGSTDTLVEMWADDDIEAWADGLLGMSYPELDKHFRTFGYIVTELQEMMEYDLSEGDSPFKQGFRLVDIV